MQFTVNDIGYRSVSGTFAAKYRFGRNAILVERSPSVERTAGLPLSQLCSSVRSLQEQTVICPVDARGCFLVEDGGNYGVCTFYVPEDYRDSLALRAQREARALALRRSGHETPKKNSARSSVSRKPATNYVKFLKQFRETFTNTSFQDAAGEWRKFSPTQKMEDTAILINAVVRTGTYQMARAAPV